MIQDGSLATRITVEGLVDGAWTELIVADAQGGENQISIPATSDGPAPSEPAPQPAPPSESPTPQPAEAPTDSGEGDADEPIVGVRVVRSVSGIGPDSAAWKR